MGVSWTSTSCVTSAIQIDVEPTRSSCAPRTTAPAALASPTAIVTMASVDEFGVGGGANLGHLRRAAVNVGPAAPSDVGAASELADGNGCWLHQHARLER